VKHVLALSSGLEADRMEYFLKDGTAPTLHDIKYVDSTCKKINPNSISTAMINSHWHVKSSDFDQDFYSNQELAENTAYAIRNYDFNYYCPSLGFMKTTANITTSPS
jgi:hypothetical protein